MPVMYAVGKTKNFRSTAEGEKAGFYISFSALAAAMRVKTFGEKAAPQAEPEPEPVEPELEVAPSPTEGMDDAAVKAVAEQAGIRVVGVSKAKIRKAVDAHLTTQDD